MNAFPLVVEKLNKRLGKNNVIQDLSFSLERGKIYGFLGPNGSGKTTTIRMIVSLIKPDTGEVFIEGNSISKNREQALEHVGAIVENPDLYLYLTGMQNLKHFADMSPRSIGQERVDEVVRLVDLEHAIHKKVKSYSLGMKQRLGIAISILHSPSVLILDEPTNGLDPQGIRDLRDYLRKLAEEEEVTLLVSSHQLSEIELLCDRAVIIKDGKLVDEVSVKAIAAETDKMTVTIEVQPPDSALELLNQSFHVTKTETGVEVHEQTYQDIPKIIRLLTDKGLSVYGVSYKKRLEDAYFSLTESKGGKGV
ncbi:ABC transporter ATP-binding protein [Shouchella patagoniensis]|uniref:ABC transporter ATP-binding protein n=1 Tax=Shouchella patagoniensis TaxID=228576 RepID=UPI000995A3F2|nr:ABC transporter ATP-binding protein [Shouchella patagoniensis]